MKQLRHQLQITDTWIMEYARSIEAPVQMVNGVPVAPATMPVLFWQAFDIPWLNLTGPLIHGTQRFSYEAPITAGMTLECELSLTKLEKKTGRQGELTLYTHTLVCTCEGEPIVTAETVLISVGERS
ncbi:FAS1-like dehydratase domain-containing protein [Paenibacillus chibensis]|uniref:FAS1-like dehydratase domain-containing protein n=1 Tax=Paenibacillus chibensis TaxID=59846 RepID=UPI000FD899D0|nr:MaoC family dehydratase N-terminal domain-containing protein [Paenibacillus chibensis]MEC0372263.1 MaoC family dehydratase N-terminal domain-containing protein [Paenibacillus chibensis]